MQDNVIERIRQRVVQELFNTTTVQRSWIVWQPIIQGLIGNNPTAQSILNLGEHLRDIFNSTKTSRSQSGVSRGGTAWEALITWYINLCCVGTRVVAVKKKSQIPSPLSDAITVNYSNFSCNTESDITVIVFPDESTFTSLNNSLLKRSGSVDMVNLSNAVLPSFSNFEIGIIQCKTNWNDNAQIPMLWDMIYSTDRFRRTHISVGKNGSSIQSLNGFSYSFVTVPTNKLNNYSSTSVCVKRVINLTGGNYWGVQSKNGVASSVKEIFHNYQNGFENSEIRRTLSNAIPDLQTSLSYFKIY